MAKEKFIDYNFSPENETLVQLAERITEDYKRQGYTLSLRQLYYQFVAANVFANDQRNYHMLGDIITNARMSGRIDWHTIVDRNRQTNDFAYYDSVADCLGEASRRFRLDKWLAQPRVVEVLVEKASLEGVIQAPCMKHEVPFASTRGFSSATAMYDMAHRMRERHLVGHKECHVLVLADHDPSGWGIGDDVKARLNQLATIPVHVHRIALNMDQIEKYNCPPNPVKLSDSRAEKYIQKHGTRSSWELDALEPSVLGDLVDSSIRMLKDEKLWDQEVRRERDCKELMQDVVDEVRDQF